MVPVVFNVAFCFVFTNSYVDIVLCMQIYYDARFENSKLKIYYSHWVIFNAFDSKNMLKNYVLKLQVLSFTTKND